MRVDVSFKHLEKSPLLEDIIDKNIEKVQRHVRLFKNDDAIHISFHLEKNPHRDDYFCWINMYLPFRVLKAQNRKNSPSIAINTSFSALLKQLDKIKHRIEKHLRKKQTK
ncbi:MAG: HPF/RaiA family ribosome-associated protein [Candidatus Omnitrophota bacterium]